MILSPSAPAAVVDQWEKLRKQAGLHPLPTSLLFPKALSQRRPAQARPYVQACRAMPSNPQTLLGAGALGQHRGLGGLVGGRPPAETCLPVSTPRLAEQSLMPRIAPGADLQGPVNDFTSLESPVRLTSPTPSTSRGLRSFAKSSPAGVVAVSWQPNPEDLSSSIIIVTANDFIECIERQLECPGPRPQFSLPYVPSSSPWQESSPLSCC